MALLARDKKCNEKQISEDLWESFPQKYLKGPAENSDLVWCRHKLSSTHTWGVQLQQLLKRLYLLTSTVLSSVCVHTEINN